MSTEAPIERLDQTIGYGPSGISEAMKTELDKDLDPARVKTKPGGGNKSYLAEHDVVRTANRIFGYGRWGTEIVEMVHLGTVQMKNAKGEEGWYTGYRCTVRLTVVGCVPVDGEGYGDAFEKQWSAQITTHELAVKEAESDAIKRAFKKWGDQFGLILYAKAEDLRRIEAEKHAEQEAASEEERRAAWAAENKASDDEVEALKEMASKVGPDVREQTEAAIKQHRDKNETERGFGPIVTKEFVQKMVAAVMKQGEAKAVAAGEQARAETGNGLKVPNGVLDGAVDITQESVTPDAIDAAFSA